MFRNLAANLVNHERIITSDAKAKEVRRVADRLITKVKRLGATAHTPAEKLDARAQARRLAVSREVGAFLPRWGVQRDGAKRDLVEKLMIELSQRMATRPGGYTRIIKLGPRRGDGASMSIIEFVDAPPVQPIEAEEAEAPSSAAAEEG